MYYIGGVQVNIALLLNLVCWFPDSKATPIKTVLTNKLQYISNVNSDFLTLPHLIIKRDESSKLDNFGEEASKTFSEFGNEASQNINRLGNDASKNLNKFGDEATKQLENFGDKSMKNIEKFGEDASKKLNKLGKDATKKLNTALKDFEGTSNDLSNYANTRGQESLDNAQDWLEDKYVPSIQYSINLGT